MREIRNLGRRNCATGLIEIGANFRRNMPPQQSITRLPLIGGIHLNQKTQFLPFEDGD